jgi:Cu-processing system ATP-binding protein
MIKIQNLHKAFGKNTVLNGIDLHIKEGGRITAVLGPNGSGKTTLIKSILGMVIPDAGSIHVQGQAIAGQWQYRAAIDYLPQIAQFPENLTVRELITMIKDIRQAVPRDEKLIERFGLESYLDERLVNLSGGTKQKVNLTLAFMYDSPLVILDEPTSGLDPVAMVRLRALIRQEKQAGKTIMITTHIMSFVEEIADDIVFLLDGKIYFQGAIQTLKEQQQETNLERAIASILDQTPSSLPTQVLASQNHSE